MHFDTNEWYEFKKDGEYFKRVSENRFYCSNCGHTVVMMPITSKKMCSWCGTWVFRDKKEEFKYRLKEGIRNVNKSR